MTQKTVFITGASSGIGAACANIFAKNGYRLIMSARRADRLEALAKQLRSDFSVEVLCLPLDVRDQASVKQACNQRSSEWQAIDVLINAAGLATGWGALHDNDPNDWDAMLDTNIKGTLYTTKYIVPNMMKQQRGHIINIGSIAARYAYPNGAVYCASKAAVRTISQGLKMDLLGTPIRVTHIDPGMVETEFAVVRFKGDTKKAKDLYKDMTPLTPEDIADTIYFCATRPAHVNMSEILMMPTDQSSAMLVHRQEEKES